MSIEMPRQASPFDTIFAPATPTGCAERAVIRVSGASAFDTVGSLARTELARSRGLETCELALADDVTLPALVLRFPAPRSYTGEDLVELHVPSSPTIVDWLADDLLARGLRLAWPGEFTRRAFENGKLALDQAEAVLSVIRAKDLDVLRRAELRANDETTRVVHEIERRLLDVLALLESGLDFTEGETGSVEPDMWLPEVDAIAGLCRKLTVRPTPRAGQPGYLLLGPANAGKTSLWNRLGYALAPGLVSADAGTTRDLRWAECDGFRIADVPGRLDFAPSLDEQELRILRTELGGCDGYVWIEPLARDPLGPPHAELGAPRLAVASKADLAPDVAVAAGWLACSTVTSAGLSELAGHLAALGGSDEATAIGPTADRLDAALAALGRAREHGKTGSSDELAAAELSDALAWLAPDRARSVPEAVLDRIFAGFCLGK